MSTAVGERQSVDGLTSDQSVKNFWSCIEVWAQLLGERHSYQGKVPGEGTVAAEHILIRIFFNECNLILQNAALTQAQFFHKGIIKRRMNAINQ